MPKKRVVVTGIGVVSSIGIGKDDFWKNLIAGKSGISDIVAFDTSNFENHKGGEVKNFNPPDFLDRKQIESMGRASQFGIAAAVLAIDDGNLKLESIQRDRIGVIMGTTMADSQILERMDSVWLKLGEKEVNPYLIPQYAGNAISNNIGFTFGLKNLVYTIPTACSAGNYSIGYSYDRIRNGKADLMLAGGSDSFSKVAFTGFSRLFAVAHEKCQPFDKNRTGIMVGEGAGVLLLELLDHAMARKANIYAEVMGYAIACDAYHMTTPSVDGITRTIKGAIKNSGINIDDVDYISAHGTGTLANDKAECESVKYVFKKRYKNIPMSSIKSMLGHTMGAASAIEAAACCMAIEKNVVPPTINHETPDPECDIDCVPNSAKSRNVNVALNNSSAFGGNNACLVLKKWQLRRNK
ncbi:MAG: beta-ketoacyl-[acyl-carrier-protein] synthase family protein [Candidatus Omnitrophota bacterium]|jgi:3-oxoacyl-[acyl-carrier-protein] synthase II